MNAISCITWADMYPRDEECCVPQRDVRADMLTQERAVSAFDYPMEAMYRSSMAWGSGMIKRIARGRESTYLVESP